MKIGTIFTAEQSIGPGGVSFRFGLKTELANHEGFFILSEYYPKHGDQVAYEIDRETGKPIVFGKLSYYGRN